MIHTKRAPSAKRPHTNNKKAHGKRQQKKHNKPQQQTKAPTTMMTKRSYQSNVMSPDFDQSIHSLPGQPAKHGIPGHKLRVMKLYRQMLRNTFDTYGSEYDDWTQRAQELHLKVAAVKNVEDVTTIETLIKDAETWLAESQHPNPYTPLMSPKGGLWGRNFPLPREALKPPLPEYEQGRNYNEEEMVVRHLHADPSDPDYAGSMAAYAALKVARGEHVEPYPEAENFVYNPVVVEYCQNNGIAYVPNLTSFEGMAEEAMQNVRAGMTYQDPRIQKAIEEQIQLFDAGDMETLHKKQVQFRKDIEKNDRDQDRI